MKNIIVLFENGTHGDFTLYPVRKEILEKIHGKIFSNKEDLQNMLMALNKSNEAYIRGLGCPKDARLANEVIENAKSFKYQNSVVVCDTRDQLKETIKKFNEIGRKVILLDMTEKNVSGKMKWVADVIEVEV